MERLNPRDLMTRALEAPNGMRIGFETYREALNARNDCYRARTKYRDGTRRLHEPTDPSWDTSPWDGLFFRVEPLTLKNPTREGFALVIVRDAISPHSIEEF